MISAVIVGGGPVALRKATALINSGAHVHLVALDVIPELTKLAADRRALRITREAYQATHIGDATLVVAATNDRDVNARIARDARVQGKLVNVADTPDLGNFVTPAVHRSGDVLIAVSAGRVPAAAVRIRDAAARSIDQRYADAIRELAALRRSLLDAGERDRWKEACAALVGEDFSAQVEGGEFPAKVAAWR